MCVCVSGGLQTQQPWTPSIVHPQIKSVRYTFITFCFFNHSVKSWPDRVKHQFGAPFFIIFISKHKIEKLWPYAVKYPVWKELKIHKKKKYFWSSCLGFPAGELQKPFFWGKEYPRWVIPPKSWLYFKEKPPIKEPQPGQHYCSQQIYKVSYIKHWLDSLILFCKAISHSNTAQ